MAWGIEIQVEWKVEVWHLNRWIAEAKIMAETEEEEAREKKGNAWRSWVKEASNNGAAALHTWIKEPRPWKPSATAKGSLISYSPSDVADEFDDVANY